jgi:hypothetical protein
MPGRNQIISSLPAPVGNAIIIEENQDVNDIIATLIYMHGETKRYYDKIASSFVGPTLRDTCENIFDFCKTNIPNITESESYQTIRTPQRILKASREGYGNDCKHYASFTAGILDALRRQGKRINWNFRFASYKLFSTALGHVFIVVHDRGNEIWIDPVLDVFDYKKAYTFAIDKSVMSPIGSRGELGAIGSISLGADNKTAATLQQVGGVIAAVGGSVAACIPAGTVVGAVIAVAGFAVSFIGKLFSSKYQYSTQVRWLTQQYQFRVLGMANVTSDNQVNESYTQAAQLWFATVLGIPMWDNLRYHTLAGTTSDTDKLSTDSYETCAQKYQAYGPTEQGVPFSACVNASKIAHTMNDHAGPGAWANFPPANIVLQQQGLTAEQVVEQAAGVLTGSAPNSAPVSTVWTSLDNSGVMVPLLIGGAALLLIANNKNSK